MTTHAPLPDTATISARIAQLPLLPMDSLWALWDEHFDERPAHHHRVWLETRLAYKIQERAFGGLIFSSPVISATESAPARAAILL